jgi:hypothetical protein
LFVHVTGRSSQLLGGSEMDRHETIEETGKPIQAAGGTGSALVVDHEDPAAVAELVAAIVRPRSMTHSKCRHWLVGRSRHPSRPPGTQRDGAIS